MKAHTWSILTAPSHTNVKSQLEMIGQYHAPATLPTEKNDGTHWIGAGLGVGIRTNNRPARSLASTPTASLCLPRNILNTQDFKEAATSKEDNQIR